ncbi:MAG: hypothetical protein VYE64_08135 [Planctomycetota bacterium]|nr:hypothetical protein [Planctomycetota bacterium]
MSKKLCDLKKLRKESPKKYAQLVSRPSHLCKKCGRVANRKKLVCQPKKLKH